MTPRTFAVASVLAVATAAVTMSPLATGQGSGSTSGALVPWPYVAADTAGTRYSPLSDINRENVGRLRVAWEWEPGEKPTSTGAAPNNFSGTPIMIDNVVYITTMYNRVVALDADTGRELWAYDPEAYQWGQSPMASGFTHRGATPWWDGGRLYLFLASRHRLIKIDAQTESRSRSSDAPAKST